MFHEHRSQFDDRTKAAMSVSRGLRGCCQKKRLQCHKQVLTIAIKVKRSEEMIEELLLAVLGEELCVNFLELGAVHLTGRRLLQKDEVHNQKKIGTKSNEHVSNISHFLRFMSTGMW